MKIAQFQIGKLGITQGTLNSLNMALKNHNRIKISVLRSSGRDRNSVKNMASSLVAQLAVLCDYTIVGFTIILIRRSSSHTKK